MNMPTSDQIHAFLRHVYTAAGTGLAVSTIFGMSRSDSDAIMDAVQTVGNSVASIIIAVGTIAPIVSAIFAAKKVSPVQQALSIVKSPDLDVTPLTPRGEEIIRQAENKA